MLPPQLVPGILIGRCTAYCHTDIICGFRRAAVYNTTVVISRNVRVVWSHLPASCHACPVVGQAPVCHQLAVTVCWDTWPLPLILQVTSYYMVTLR